MAMKLSQYRQNIVAPILIYGDSAVGKKMVDDPLFDYVEQQMMKVGSLAHDTIEWDTVEERTLQLLTEYTKDIKLLTYLMQCLYHQLSPARFNMSIFILAEFIDHFWDEAYPAPGPKGRVPRKRFLAQIVQRMNDALKHVDINRFVDEREEELNQALELLEKSCEKRELDDDDMGIFIRHVRNQLNQMTERRQLEKNQKEAEAAKGSDGSGSVQGESGSSSMSSVVVDTSNEKATKTTLLKVAEILSEKEIGSALSVRVRRHAVWSAINSLPDHNAQGETQLRPMQQDRIKDYQDMMVSPDMKLWRQVEQSLTMAPYWFEGHLMSYQIAKELDKTDWCEAIKDETLRFLERLPKLKELSFKGGIPFVSLEVLEWLEEGQSAPESSGRVEGWATIRKDVTQLAAEEGINEAFVVVNEGLANAAEPRAQWYWRLVSADLLKGQGFEAMAKEQYQTLYRQALEMTVPDWEPSIVQQLEKYSTSE